MNREKRTQEKNKTNKQKTKTKQKQTNKTQANKQTKNKLKNNHLLIEVDSKKYTENLIKMKASYNLKCKTYPH